MAHRLTQHRCGVALRKESVDRNPCAEISNGEKRVALRKESVDRNFGGSTACCAVGVALRKESVDRNFLPLLCGLQVLKSLSARRAWIEML